MKLQRRYAAIALIGVAAILVLALYFNAVVSSVLSTQHVAAVGGPIASNVSVLWSGAFTYGFSSSFMELAKMRYVFRNVTSANVSFTIYNARPITEIYIVDPGNFCDQCFVGSSLYVSMEGALSRYGLMVNASSLNLINIDSLRQIPRSSIVIIPTGLMPDVLMPYIGAPSGITPSGCTAYGNETLLGLLNQSDTVIYVGRNFSTSVTCSQQLFQTPATTLGILANASILALPTAKQRPNGPLNFNSSTFYLFNSTFYYNVPEAHSGNGTLIVLSNYPAAGWRNASALADDIARVINSRYWIARLAYGNSTLRVSNDSGTDVLLTNERMIGNSSVVANTLNGAYSLITLNLFNSNKTLQQELPFRIHFARNGAISMAGVAGVAQQEQISVEALNISPQSHNLFSIQIFNLSMVTPIESIASIGVLSNDQVYYAYKSFDLKPGYYIAQLIDSQGRTYSNAIFKIANVTIAPIKLDFRNSSFMFSLSSNNQTLNNVPYSVNFDNSYNQSSVISAGIVEYTLPKGAVVGYGNHTFVFDVFGYSYPVTEPYKNVGLKIPSLYIEFAVAIVFILILNRVLVAPQIDEYYINVPDFQPSKKQKVKETDEAILGVFDTVNSYYRWRNIPLTAEEVKFGVSNNIRYGNMPISITLQNALVVLNKLVNKGLVVSAEGYYAPKRWMDSAGHDIEYLATFRRIRDYFVANAVLFTELGSAGDADIIATSKGSQKYIYIYSQASGMRQMTLSNRSKTYIAFLTEEKKLDFLDMLYNSYGEYAEVIKSGIAYSQIVLVDSYNLGLLNF